MQRWILAFLAIGLVFAQDWMSQGIEAYKHARYQEAAAAFQKAIELNPDDVTAHLYLATALMSQYIPGAERPENLELAHKAEDEFNAVLRMDPNNKTALASLASLSYQRAQGMPAFEKLQKLDEAVTWYEKVIAVDPHYKEAYYSLGVIDWMKWYPAWTRARADLGMKPQDPGPLRDPALRQQLKQQYSAVIEHGISNLEKALQIDPQYDDAMAYINLLIRERADLRDRAEDYRLEIEAGDAWVRKALDTKRMKAQAAAAAVQRIRVGGDTQSKKLIQKIDPVYPALAKQARIQGVVRLTVIISSEGRVLNMQLVSGHPLLVEAARWAVSQWEYERTLLNGQPVEVVTLVDVNFTLP